MQAFNDRISGSARTTEPEYEPETPFAERLEPTYEDETYEEETPFLKLDESEGGYEQGGDPYQSQFRVRTEGDFESEGSGSGGRRKRAMAQFDPVIQRTLKYEGGYANDPADRGGETYRGVSRKFHPQWGGWAIIDGYKKAPNFPATLDRDQSLPTMVTEFYRTEFWNKISGDAIADQAIAGELFDSAVNGGIGAAVKILQQAINLFRTSDQLSVDGGMSDGIVRALNDFVARPVRAQALLSAMVVLRGIRYMNIISNKPSQRKFAVGWFSRLRC